MDNIQQDVSDTGMARAIEDNFLATFSLFRLMPQVQVVESPYALRITSSAVPDPLVNGILRAQFPSDSADRHIEEIIATFHERHLPLLWQIWPSTRPADIGARLIAAGLSEAGTNAGMALDLHQLENHPPPSPVHIHRVEDADRLRQWLPIVRAGFELDDLVVDLIADLSRQLGFGPTARVQNYIGYWEEEPVACASSISGAGVTGIYNVATLPAARGRGIGTAVTRQALLDARDRGYRIAILHSTLMGYSIYQSLGFKEYFKIRLYYRET